MPYGVSKGIYFSFPLTFLQAVIPLFSKLDGKISADYSQRVQPSAKEDHKMANLLVDAIFGVNHIELHKTKAI